jgi:hypothetical protein
MTAGRNCIGYEIEGGLQDEIDVIQLRILPFANEAIKNRIGYHVAYLEANIDSKGGFNYQNAYYNFPVNTRQETEIFLNPLKAIKKIGQNFFEVTYSDKPHQSADPQTPSTRYRKPTSPKNKRRSLQQKLW